jgi:hypothetical protein
MTEKPQKHFTTGKPTYIGDSMPSEFLKTTLSRPPAQPAAPAKPTTAPPAQTSKGGK